MSDNRSLLYTTVGSLGMNLLPVRISASAAELLLGGTACTECEAYTQFLVYLTKNSFRKVSFGITIGDGLCFYRAIGEALEICYTEVEDTSLGFRV